MPKSDFVQEYWKDFAIPISVAIILAIAVSFPDFSIFSRALIFLILIVGLNFVAKKIHGWLIEVDVKAKLWSWYQYGFRTDSHFKKPVPMLWLPLLISFITRGLFYWLAVMTFDVKPRTGRVSRKYGGYYRFKEVTEWDMALIVTTGISVNLFLALVGYIAASWVPSLEIFAKLNIYYALWSFVPISELDGSKLLFGSKGLWVFMLIITMLVIAGIFLIA